MAIKVGQTRLVLASASPRRREFLERMGLSFEVDPADIDESVMPGERAQEYVMRIAQHKAAKVAQRRKTDLVLAADTSVVLGEEILGKPQDPEHARQILARLSNQEHVVMTAVALDGAERLSLRVETKVRFRKLSDAEIAWYVGTGEGHDKAGGYALQGRAGAFITSVEGSPSNVIGLPLADTVELLRRAGVEVCGV